MFIFFVKMQMNASSSVYVNTEVVVWTLMDHTHVDVRKAGRDNIVNLVCILVYPVILIHCVWLTFFIIYKSILSVF